MKNRIRRTRAFFLFFLSIFCLPVCASAAVSGQPEDLYARSACLMDGSSGRILFGKNEDEVLPMASTTKIMTCIVALEQAKPEDIVEVSAHAAAQPDVSLGMQEGERYYLEDLLYSLMLESHNDSAVAIAEHVAGSVEAFAALMNEKARKIGCEHTHYVTPNGLDETDVGGAHATTAAELALVMSYCVDQSPARGEFLKITQTRSYSFSDTDKTRSFSCQNHNSFLDMMDGVISGKTGFTSAAGYCYVCALEDDGRLFTVALLACGWPYNRSYKWSDAKKLLSYGLENYRNRTVSLKLEPVEIFVEEGLAQSKDPWEKAYVQALADTGGTTGFTCLLREDEKVSVHTEVKKSLTAPAQKGTVVGKAVFTLDGAVLKEYPVATAQDAEKKYPEDCFFWVLRYYML